jgi:hypothetical protein
MLDFIRNLGKSAEEKRQEALTAYLDNALTPAQRQAFERELAQDASLRETMEQQRRLKMQLRQLPRLAAPRRFTLDPAVHGQQRPATTMGSYTILRTATALVAFFFVLALVVDFSSFRDRAPTVAMEEAAPAAEQVSGGVVADSVESEADDAEEEEPAEEIELEVEVEEEMAEEPAQEPTPEPAEDVAEEEAGEADGDTFGYPLASPTPQPTLTVASQPTLTVAADEAQTEQPVAAAPETTVVTPSVPAASGGPRPTLTPTSPGRDNEPTALPIATLVQDTANTAAPTPIPTIVSTTEPNEPASTFRIIEVALGALFLVLLGLTLLLRRRL